MPSQAPLWGEDLGNFHHLGNYFTHWFNRSPYSVVSFLAATVFLDYNPTLVTIFCFSFLLRQNTKSHTVMDQRLLSIHSSLSHHNLALSMEQMLLSPSAFQPVFLTIDLLPGGCLV